MRALTSPTAGLRVRAIPPEFECPEDDAVRSVHAADAYVVVRRVHHVDVVTRGVLPVGDHPVDADDGVDVLGERTPVGIEGGDFGDPVAVGHVAVVRHRGCSGVRSVVERAVVLQGRDTSGDPKGVDGVAHLHVPLRRTRRHSVRRSGRGSGDGLSGRGRSGGGVRDGFDGQLRSPAPGRRDDDASAVARRVHQRILVAAGAVLAGSVQRQDRFPLLVDSIFDEALDLDGAVLLLGVGFVLPVQLHAARAFANDLGVQYRRRRVGLGEPGRNRDHAQQQQPDQDHYRRLRLH